MSLPQLDIQHLEDKGYVHEIKNENSMTCIVLHEYQLPSGYDRPQADLLIRLGAGYPDVPPDMWWFDPPIKPSDGRTIPNTECTEWYLGRGWQRWSRHFSAGQWLTGIDCLESYLALVRKEVEKWAAPFPN
jgi:hypothetical protein